MPDAAFEGGLDHAVRPTRRHASEQAGASEAEPSGRCPSGKMTLSMRPTLRCPMIAKPQTKGWRHQSRNDRVGSENLTSPKCRCATEHPVPAHIDTVSERMADAGPAMDLLTPLLEANGTGLEEDNVKASASQLLCNDEAYGAGADDANIAFNVEVCIHLFEIGQQRRLPASGPCRYAIII
jgi:hypothetical protein